MTLSPDSASGAIYRLLGRYNLLCGASAGHECGRACSSRWIAQ